MNSERMLFPIDELDGMRCVYEVLLHAKQKYKDRCAYKQLEYNGDESQITFAELGNRVDALRAALFQSELFGSHFAILGETSIEWITAYLAVVSGAGVCIPMDKELSDDSMAHQLDVADTEVAFVSEKYLQKLLSILPRCPKLKTVIVMRGEAEPQESCRVLSLCGLIERGREEITRGASEKLPAVDPEKACLIIFTSGTTGANKGVLLSNRNILGSLRGCARLLKLPKTVFSVLPVNHSYELHTSILYCLYSGTCVCINDELRYIIKNLKRFKPDGSCMVPMMLDTLVSQLKREIRKSGKEKAFEKAVKLSNGLRKLGIDKRRRIFRDILDNFGGNLSIIVCGGAKLDQDVADFLGSIGIDVYNGYGITECSPVVAVNSMKLMKRGSIGRILPTVRARIANPDENGNGEIQISGDSVMLGYYKDEEDTAAVFTEDGWFRTGDIGYKDKDEYLYINGRIKNLIVLPNGKNIYPEEIEETLMKKVPYIRECVVTENSRHDGLYAYIYPDLEFCAENGLDTADEIKAFLRKDIDTYNRAEPGCKRLSGYEIREREFEKNTVHKILRYKVV